MDIYYRDQQHCFVLTGFTCTAPMLYREKLNETGYYADRQSYSETKLKYFLFSQVIKKIWLDNLSCFSRRDEKFKSVS